MQFWASTVGLLCHLVEELRSCSHQLLICQLDKCEEMRAVTGTDVIISTGYNVVDAHS